MKLRPSAFTDTDYHDAAKAYAAGEMSDAAWDRMMKRPLFRVWLKHVIKSHFEVAPHEF